MRFTDKNINTIGIVSEAQTLLNSSRHYNQSDRVKEIIRILYSNCCAFCECSPEDGSFFQIEHFYPKNIRRFYSYAKRIENLHYSCQRCNTLKGRLLHSNIFSPNYYLDNRTWRMTFHDKIETELFYIGHLLFSYNPVPTSIDRGHSTISLFDLNNQNNSVRSSRQFLVESRLRVFSTSFDILNTILELLLNYSSKLNNAIELLFLMLVKTTNRTEHFSTMVIHNFGREIYKLLSIYIKIRN